MVNIKPNDELANKLLSEMMSDIAEDRSNQPSVTTLIDCLTKTFYNQQMGSALEYTDQTKMYFLIGLGLEQALLTRRKEQTTHGVKDGIYFHVDSIDDGLIEVKSTRSSVKNTEANFSTRWLRQTMSYAVALGVTFLDVAVVYLIPAEFKVYRVEFDEIELAMHWAWMETRRDVWNQARETETSPKAFHWNEEWECKGCQYKIVCDMKAGRGL